MTKDEALRLALDTLKEVRDETFRLLRNGEKLYSEDKVWSTIISVQEALETKDKPVSCAECGASGGHALYCVACAEKFVNTEEDCVGWFGYDTGLRLWFEADKNDDGAIPLYKDQQQRTWVGLTEEDLKPICDEWRIVYGCLLYTSPSPRD